MPSPAETIAPKPYTLKTILRFNPFRTLWLAQFVSVFGDFLALFGVISLITFRWHGTAVQVTTVTVDPTGIVRMTPQGGVQIDLSGSSSWTLQSPATAFTAPNGDAVWTVVCQTSGVQPLTATVAGQAYGLNIPACVQPPPQTFESPSTTFGFG